MSIYGGEQKNVNTIRDVILIWQYAILYFFGFGDKHLDTKCSRGLFFLSLGTFHIIPLFATALYIIYYHINDQIESIATFDHSIIYAIFGLFVLGILASFNLIIKRIKDLGGSHRLIILFLLPFIAHIFWLVLLFGPSKDKTTSQSFLDTFDNKTISISIISLILIQIVLLGYIYFIYREYGNIFGDFW